MPGTKAGGKKIAAANYARYGDDFYRRLGKLGGDTVSAGTARRGFASMPRSKVSAAGRKGGAIGGKISKRGPANA